MAEDPQPLTLQQRIASLNAAHMARVPGETMAVTNKPKPQLPNRRPNAVRHNSINIPNENVNGTVSERPVGNQPSGPPPLPVRRPPPPLSTRNGSQEHGRRESVTSITSTSAASDVCGPRVTATRTKSDENRIKAPAWGEGELPPLPVRVSNLPKSGLNTGRPQNVNKEPSTSSQVQPVVTNGNRRPTLPPPLPSRKASTDHAENGSARKLPPMPSAISLEKARQASFSNNAVSNEEENSIHANPKQPSFSGRNGAISKITEAVSSLPMKKLQPVQEIKQQSQPPPIPLSSRPDLTALQASKPKPNAHTNGSNTGSETICMICRDFSEPDLHASRFPRQQATSLQTLAYQLTSPFPSLTDKARAIFLWLHYNIDYNVEAFFNNKVRGSTPESTLQTGLAVCEGYSALFANLATYAGLEAVVIGGHGKGYGHVQLAPGSPIPPYSAGHAWNAVKIDSGEWKLIDACWGAGHVQGKNMPYVRKFAPERFTQSNEEFGIDHFPGNKDQFFLPGGRRMSWEEYIQINPESWPYDFERPTMFNNAKEDYSIGKRTVMPPNRKISVYQQGTVRFQFGLFCPHWTLEHHTKKGLPPVFILAVEGVDGRNKDFVPLDHVRGQNTSLGGGDTWYADVPARELGAPGQTVTLFAVTSFGNRQDARGLTVREFNEGKGRTGMGFVGVAAWELIA